MTLNCQHFEWLGSTYNWTNFGLNAVMENIHLKTMRTFAEGLNVEKTTSVITNFIQSCIDLNVSVFEPFVSEDDIFEDKDKYNFLADLRDLFQKSKIKARFERSVKLSDAKCLGCVYGQSISRFDVYERNELKYDFGFVIEIKEGILQDIYRCNFYREKPGVWLRPEGMPAIYVEYKPNVK